MSGRRFKQFGRPRLQPVGQPQPVSTEVLLHSLSGKLNDDEWQTLTRLVRREAYDAFMAEYDRRRGGGHDGPST